MDRIERVAGIVITYHPDAEVMLNLAAVRPLVSELIVVDNGSDPGAFAMLQKACDELGFDLIANSDNLGMPAALNIGIQRAIELGCDGLLLFDQDSRVTAGFVAAMLSTYADLSTTRRIGILVPQYTDLRTNQPLPFTYLRDGTLVTAISSGSLISVSTYLMCGPIADELFMDSFDHEYSLRIRKAGYIIAECETAVLLHSPGTPRSHALFGLIKFKSTNYSPSRRYYMERNKVWLYRRYVLDFPAFCSRQLLQSPIELLKILLVESDKREKCRFFFRGIYDGVRERMGKLRLEP